MKKNSFIGGAFIATLGIIIVKVIGLLYVIPFNMIIGEQGGALYGYGNYDELYKHLKSQGFTDTEILASINIPEVTEDYITEIIGYIDEKPVQSKIPCAKCKNTSYRLILEVSYPNTLNEEIKRKTSAMYQYYSHDEEKQYGVVGIKISLVK